MLLGILSDTHDQLERTRIAVDLLRGEGAEALIHCGDLMTPPIVAVCAALPCYFVFGNNDADLPELRQAMAEAERAICLGWGGTITLAKRRIAVTHGHRLAEVRGLLETAPDYLFTGHSHLANDWREGPTRRINPGALYRAREYTVALMDLETDELRFLTVPRQAPRGIMLG
jgi:hypothetical protein